MGRKYTETRFRLALESTKAILNVRSESYAKSTNAQKNYENRYKYFDHTNEEGYLYYYCENISDRRFPIEWQPDKKWNCKFEMDRILYAAHSHNVVEELEGFS